MARGELKIMGATTLTEFRKYFEKDPAMARRFQMVKVEGPDP
jgi:ATP-dependent Clp protease ATP-binding subunit ClpA